MADPHILIVVARFYEDIADALVGDAAEAVSAAGGSYEVVEVPGAFEIPAVIGMAIDTGRFDGYVALGCVIRGETTHYDYVCGESARGVNELAVTRRIAVGYGILTTENRDQAWERAGPRKKGKDAAEACLAMIRIKRRFAGDEI